MFSFQRYLSATKKIRHAIDFILFSLNIHWFYSVFIFNFLRNNTTSIKYTTKTFDLYFQCKQTKVEKSFHTIRTRSKYTSSFQFLQIKSSEYIITFSQQQIFSRTISTTHLQREVRFILRNFNLNLNLVYSQNDQYNFMSKSI